MKLRNTIIALVLSATASHGATLVNAGSGTFTTVNEVDTFNKFVGSSAVIQKVTLTMTALASQTGTVVTNQSAGNASFTGSIGASYATTLLGFIAGGTINLSDAQTSGTLAPTEFFTYNLADSDTLIVEFSSAIFGLFATATPDTGNIVATTLNSAFTVTSTPINTAYGVSGGTSATNYTWNLVYTVPEPSAALLGGIGALFLLRRRNR